MEELALGEREEHPAPEPPGRVDEPSRGEAVVQEFQRARTGVDRDRDAELICRADPQGEAGQGGANGGGIL